MLDRAAAPTGSGAPIGCGRGASAATRAGHPTAAIDVNPKIATNALLPAMCSLPAMNDPKANYDRGHCYLTLMFTEWPLLGAKTFARNSRKQGEPNFACRSTSRERRGCGDRSALSLASLWRTTSNGVEA